MRLDKAFEAAIAGAEVAPTLAKFRKAASGMEQVFLKQLFSQMRQVSLTGEKDSHGMDMYKDMMDDALAESLAKRGDFGVAKQLQQAMEPGMFRQEIANVRLRARRAMMEEKG